MYSGRVPRQTLELVHLRVSQINGCSARVDAGAASVEVRIAITPDTHVEPNETVTLTLTAASGDGRIDPNGAVATGVNATARVSS